MPDDLTLITGAAGEIGHGLLKSLGTADPDRLLALDRNDLGPELRLCCREFLQADVLDQARLADLGNRFQIGTIYHLAAVLSTSAEHNPRVAHRVNVEGTFNLLEFAGDQARQRARPVTFIFPSSIAVYGFANLAAKLAAGPVTEQATCSPTTIYGASKLHCEHLGAYFSQSRLREPGEAAIDFRALRLPGLISAETLPTGGTSDYGPEMLHHAAEGRPYRCFVRPDTRMPFLTMPDAVRALTELAGAPSLGRQVYNVTGFSPSAEELQQIVMEFFPNAEIDYEPDSRRQAIVDSWPAEVEDRAARDDWGWAPEHGLRAAFEEYLIPAVSRRYAAAGEPDAGPRAQGP
ncbi:MAG: NAD-dependent epimerase/dehydratase family protein [Anaerolineales bacterium]